MVTSFIFISVIFSHWLECKMILTGEVEHSRKYHFLLKFVFKEVFFVICINFGDLAHASFCFFTRAEVFLLILNIVFHLVLCCYPYGFQNIGGGAHRWPHPSSYLVLSHANTCPEIELFCRVIKKPPSIQYHMFSVVYWVMLHHTSVATAI